MKVLSTLQNIELNLFVFSFLVNFVWEMWQVPYFLDMVDAPHFSAVIQCTWATAGDALISVTAFWAGSLISRSRTWIYQLRANQMAFVIYLGWGVAMTILLEWISTGMLGRWAYSDAMPRLPIIGTGLVPLLQWTVLPPVVLYFVVRQTSALECGIFGQKPRGVIDEDAEA